MGPEVGRWSSVSRRSLVGRLLVRERSALSDPYCQSTWMSVSLSVCVSRLWRSNISKTKGDRG